MLDSRFSIKIMWINQIIIIYLLRQVITQVSAEKREKRYLLFTSSTQWGVFVTLSIPLPHPEQLVSVAWFFEANYYNVANASYFEPLLGDVEKENRNITSLTYVDCRAIYLCGVSWFGFARLTFLWAVCSSGLWRTNGFVQNSTDYSKIPSLRQQRSTQETNQIVTRRSTYIFIESMLENHGYSGRACLLRAICESASQFLHNGVLGDLLHLVLTPSSSMSEDDIEDCYYEAEYWGSENHCEDYFYDCPINPIDNISVNFE